MTVHSLPLCFGVHFYHFFIVFPLIHHGNNIPFWKAVFQIKFKRKKSFFRIKNSPINPLCVLLRAYKELKFCPLLLVKPPLVKALMRACSTLRFNVPRQWYRFPLQKNNWKGCHKFVHCHWVAIISLLIAIIVIEYSMLSIAKGVLMAGQCQSSSLLDCDPVLS